MRLKLVITAGSVDLLLGREIFSENRDDVAKLLSDCTPYECNLILGTITGLKQALRTKPSQEHE